ncbi:MAG TPA: tetratricopeptide repeat protein [Candidatus Binatia bacterium]|nr:tetratricopeptide repeat protein [Candidatus Binatia bacterium]
MKWFSTAEVANIVRLPDSRIRSLVRAGLLAPQRTGKKSLQFSFQDLLLLKTAKTLLESHIPARRIARMLASLKRQLPDEQHLCSVKIYADGRRVVAWDGRARWQPDSGQFLFNFDAKSVAAAAKAPRVKPAKEKLTARYWFNLALELESTSAEEARQAYRRALELEPEMSDAHLNLGRLYHEAGMLKESEAHYRAAMKLAPEEAAPHFNLGVLLEDLNRPREAVRCYHEALAKDPDFADAHYNLGLLLESLGKRQEAFAHLRTARRLYTGK